LPVDAGRSFAPVSSEGEVLTVDERVHLIVLGQEGAVGRHGHTGAEDLELVRRQGEGPRRPDC
jgi:hypothetical protein